MTASTWSLHPQLAQDTVPVGDLPLTRVLLANDANYPWLILVPRLPGLVELIDLEENAQVQRAQAQRRSVAKSDMGREAGACLRIGPAGSAAQDVARISRAFGAKHASVTARRMYIASLRSAPISEAY
jgi:hypothetical protein